MNHCSNCQKETENPKFCSRSCSSSYSNKVKPKRKMTKQCKVCQCLIGADHVYCSDCYQNDFLIGDVTIAEAIYTKHHRSSAYALVRLRARAVGKTLGYTKCAACGYDKHVEICHIKSISSFPDDTFISIVNRPENLTPLCPNHHWEFDNGLLKLK